ncbi:MAG: tripartite tricarboxylate transporter substrate binding protein [Betaproteobacteria bacterium]
MLFNFKKFLTIILVIQAGLALSQSFPNKPIRLIIPSAAGGGIDQMARILAVGLSEKIGQPVITENRGGAGGSLAMDYGAHAQADGYTLTLVYQSMGANPFIYSKLPFDTIKDFAPISLLTYYQLVLIANNSLPAQNISDLITLAKNKPEFITFGSSGTGGASHLAFELLMNRTGTRFLHVPYKGNAPAMTDLIGGQIMTLVDAVSSVAPAIRSGKIKALGVTSTRRSNLLPDIQTISETIPGYESIGWYGIVSPAGVPKDRIIYLNKVINSVLNEPAIKNRLIDSGNEIVGSSPDEFADFIRAEMRKYESLVRDAGIKATQ